jgi:hypothetical protein
MSLPEEQPSYKEPSPPVGRMQLGLAALFVTPTPKKMMETATDLLMRTFHWQEEAIEHNGCKGCFEQCWAYAYSSHDKDDSFCRMGFRKVQFERQLTPSHGKARWCH